MKMKQEYVIKVSSKDKISSIRVTEKTKRMLESFGRGGESHEEILLKVLKLMETGLVESGTQIISKNNVTGTKYKRLHKTFRIETDKGIYSVVCVFNDLSIIWALKRNKQMHNYMHNANELEWEINLEIVNFKYNPRKDEGAKAVTRQIKQDAWMDPMKLRELDYNEYILIYLVCIKQILEKAFDIQIYEIMKYSDYLNVSKWKEVYSRNQLSMESFYNDIEKKLR